MVTAPLHKEGLHAAGLPYPGHTEILAERSGVREFAMVLAVEGLAVAHVTLHMALRDVFRHLTTAAVWRRRGCWTACYGGCWDGSRGSAWRP